MHLLLMLSGQQQPAPDAEVNHHAHAAAGEHGVAELLHTLQPHYGVGLHQVADQLQAEESCVLCYGDLQNYGYQLLGGGYFHAAVAWPLAAGLRHGFFQRHPIYAHQNLPPNVTSVIQMTGFAELADHHLQDLADVGATFWAPGQDWHGLPVTPANLPGPPYQRRAALFFDLPAGMTARGLLEALGAQV